MGTNIRFVHLCRAIQRMLEKAEGVLLPITKEQQNRNLTGQFFACFPLSAVKQMKKILESEQYIPQEILNIRDFGE